MTSHSGTDVPAQPAPKITTSAPTKGRKTTTSASTDVVPGLRPAAVTTAPPSARAGAPGIALEVRANLLDRSLKGQLTGCPSLR